MRSRTLLVFVLEVIFTGHAILFGGGGDGCCCNCGAPMPSSCGCTQLTPPPLPICPPPIPCPPPICPICQICPPPSCPPPPVALCPPPQPIYLPVSSCSCGAADGAFGGYATGKNFQPPHSDSYVKKDVQIGGLTTERAASPPSAYPNHLTRSEITDLDIQELRSVQNADENSDDPTDLDITNQLAPLSSTAASVTARRTRGAVVISENKCNSAVMRDLLIKNMEHTDPVISKRLIHKATQESMNEDSVDIICSNSGFTYIVSTTEYCEAQNEEVICFVYRKP